MYCEAKNCDTQTEQAKRLSRSIIPDDRADTRRDEHVRECQL